MIDICACAGYTIIQISFGMVSGLSMFVRTRPLEYDHCSLK